MLLNKLIPLVKRRKKALNDISTVSLKTNRSIAHLLDSFTEILDKLDNIEKMITEKERDENIN